MVPSVTLYRVEREIVVVKREVFKFQIELRDYKFVTLLRPIDIGFSVPSEGEIPMSMLRPIGELAFQHTHMYNELNFLEFHSNTIVVSYNM